MTVMMIRTMNNRWWCDDYKNYQDEDENDDEEDDKWETMMAMKMKL